MWVFNPFSARLRAQILFVLSAALLIDSSWAQMKPVDAGTSRSPAEIMRGVDMQNAVERARVASELETAERIRYARVRSKAMKLGIPERIDGPKGQVSILYDMRGDQPIYRKTLNVNAAISSAANLVRVAPYSLSGAGVQVGIWDAGSVFNSHQEFTRGRVTNVNAVAADDHATHVAGTIGAAGVTANARGMATNVWIDSYDWNNDYAEMIAAGAAGSNDLNGKVTLSNHSYGYGATAADMGVYNAEAASADALLEALPYYLPFWAAGNEQTDLPAKNGYQSITFVGLAKNLVTVGAISDAVNGTNRSLAAGTMSSFSSWGPTDDGRIKPDIVANGVTVYSSISTGTSAYDTYDGTSMATPSACGSAALLVELYGREFGGSLMRASTLKALLIHTADDLGVAGPDYKFGWGLMNTKAAADVILSQKVAPAAPKLMERKLSPALTSRNRVFRWDGVSPIRATLAWTDPAATARADNDRSPVLVHNLELRVTGPDGTIYMPYVMPFATNFTDANFGTAAIKGSNAVDNVERIDIPSPSLAGLYTVRVSHGGSWAKGEQVYSLVLTGTSPSNLPPVFDEIDPISVVEGRGVQIPVRALDPADGDAMTLIATNLPIGSAFPQTNAAGTFVWGAATPVGDYAPRFIATDKDGSATQTISLTVVSNQPPVLNPIGPKRGILLQAMTFSINASDPVGNDSITLTASNVPPGAVFSSTNGNGTFSWASPPSVGTYEVHFTASDLSGSSSETVFIRINPQPYDVIVSNKSIITLNALGSASPYPSALTVTQRNTQIERVSVRLHGFAHSYPSDMDLILVGPQGQKSVIMSALGSDAAVSGLTLLFDDTAESAAPAILTSGTWKPGGPITAALPSPAPGLPYVVGFTNFVDTSPEGVWSLYATDLNDVDSGSITGGWSLVLSLYELSAQPPVFDLVLTQRVALGSTLELDVVARDGVDQDMITLSADLLPPGAIFSSTAALGQVTNRLIWNNVGPVGSYSAAFRAQDKDGSSILTIPIEVFLPPPTAPSSLWASATNNSGFTAAWTPVAEADSYRLDVSSEASFERVSETGTPVTILSHIGTPGSGTGGTWTEVGVGGTTYLIMTSSASRVTSPSAYFRAGLSNALTFNARTYGGSSAANNTITVSVSTNNGLSWIVLGTRIPQSTTLSPMLPFDLEAYGMRDVMIRFETLGASAGRGAGVSAIALRSLVYETVPYFASGYSNRFVASSSEGVNGLESGVTYHFRVRSVNAGGMSTNSATVSVSTTIDEAPPVFVSPSTSIQAVVGIETSISIVAIGAPLPVVALASQSVSTGYTFNGSVLVYRPLPEHAGSQVFSFIASNRVGVATQGVEFLVVAPPVIPIAPTSVLVSVTNETDFTASWTVVTNADRYEIDVSTSVLFGSFSTPAQPNTEPFEGIGGGAASSYLTRSWTNNGVVWTSAKARTDQTIAGASLTLQNAADAYFRSGTITGGIQSLSIVCQQKFSGTGGTYDVIINGVKLGNAIPITTNVVTNWIENIGIADSFTILVTNSGAVRPAFDQLTWSPASTFQPHYVPGYSSRVTYTTSQSITGLTEGLTYHLRVRAANLAGTSANSQTTSVILVSGGGYSPDQNADGIPDSWFSAHGLSPTNLSNATIPSGGATYREAYLHDVDPNQPLPIDFNRVVPSNAPGSIMTFVIAPSSTGRLYDVFGMDDLMSTNWIPVNLDRPGNGARLVLTVTNAVDDRYYRTGVKLPR